MPAQSVCVCVCCVPWHSHTFPIDMTTLPRIECDFKGIEPPPAYNRKCFDLLMFTANVWVCESSVTSHKTLTFRRFSLQPKLYDPEAFGRKGSHQGVFDRGCHRCTEAIIEFKGNSLLCCDAPAVCVLIGRITQKTNQPIFIQFCGRLGCDPEKKQINLGVDPQGGGASLDPDETFQKCVKFGAAWLDLKRLLWYFVVFALLSSIFAPWWSKWCNAASKANLCIRCSCFLP